MKVRAFLVVTALASTAHATKTIDVYSIWYSSDLTDKTQIETFQGCLASSSTFGTTWGALFGIGPVKMHAPIVLQTAPPNPLQIDGSVQAEINKAIGAGTVPRPTGSEDTIYFVHGPSSVRNNASDGSRLCYNNRSCGEHGPGTYNGVGYQAALVPLDCPLCGGTLRSQTWIGEHEIAEAAADEGTASFEVGDWCEQSNNITQLSCCGQSFTIQQLDTPKGPGACQTIQSTGSSCTCGVVQSDCADAGSCCTGMTCQPWVAKVGDTPKNVCCFEAGQGCGGTNDCCGGLSCSQGKCVCQPLGKFCLRDMDCCNGNVCDMKQQLCVTPPPPVPDAGMLVDGGSEAGDVGDSEIPVAMTGCGCSTVPTKAAPLAGVLAIAGAALLRRRRKFRL